MKLMGDIPYDGEVWDG